jgi:hypothetical protein
MISNIKNKEQKTFRVANSTSFTETLEDMEATVDVLFSNMMIPCLESYGDFRRTFEQIAASLKNNGVAIIGTSHPCFDPYMQKYFLNRADVETDFESYYTSEKPFKITKDNGFTFEDYHYTLADFINIPGERGLQLELIDECRSESTNEDIFPKYLVIKYRKL